MLPDPDTLIAEIVEELTAAAFELAAAAGPMTTSRAFVHSCASFKPSDNYKPKPNLQQSRTSECHQPSESLGSP